jgi:hypothetical protein
MRHRDITKDSQPSVDFLPRTDAEVVEFCQDLLAVFPTAFLPTEECEGTPIMQLTLPAEWAMSLSILCMGYAKTMRTDSAVAHDVRHDISLAAHIIAEALRQAGNASTVGIPLAEGGYLMLYALLRALTDDTPSIPATPCVA